ncbi:hypothetical protein [Emticicia sp. BO119]|uniref:hypothetical protein n=1 Tax=Emticicia sp. BO119 TaxID=2757768 RepID=UPI0015EFE1E0|nr:hypothetical protein [Emticicia sp. BO119]MBA4849838.1 hypothetical protein [Emticicia sp. BO119]
MATIQNRQRDIKNVFRPDSKNKASRDTSSGNRDERPDSRDIKDEVEKPKSKLKY